MAPDAPAIPYEDLRGNIADGDVLLFRSKGTVASVIRWATRSTYSHAAMAAWYKDRLMVLESRELRGCRAVPLSAALVAGEILVLRTRGGFTMNRTLAIDEAVARLGGPYGWASILRIALSKLPLALLRRIPVLGRVIPRGPTWSEDDETPSGPRMICSEYVARCYRAGGVDLVPNLADRDTTPGDIARSAALAPVGRILA